MVRCAAYNCINRLRNASRDNGITFPSFMAMTTDKELDDVLDAIGCGLWQIPVLVLSIVTMLVLPVHSMGSTLLSAPIAFRCFSASNASQLSLQSPNVNFTNNVDGQNSTAPFYDSKCLDPESHVLLGNAESFKGESHFTGLPSCPWVSYDQSIFLSTIVSEWNLICEREMLKPLFQMMYSVGALIGGFIGGQVSDSFGRKRAVQIATFINVTSAVLLYFSPLFSVTLLTRAVIGGSCNFMFLPAYSLALETIPSKHRTVVGMLLGIPYSVGIIILAGTGYVIRVWKHLMILNAATPFIFIIPLIFWVNESPRWLIQHGNALEASKMLSHAAKVNKVTLSDPLTEAIQELRKSHDEEKGIRRRRWELCRETCKDASSYFQSVGMRLIFLISPIAWLLQGCLYLGVILNANNFSSNDPFVYITISGAMDMISILLTTPLSMRIGRRALIAWFLLVGGVLFMIDLIVPEALHWLKFALVMTALTLVAGSFQINFLYTPELYPTLLRTRGLALSNFACNIGFMVAPLVVDLLAPLAWWSVGVTFGCGGLVASILVPFLPETLHRPLPDTVLDVDERHENSHYYINWTRKRRTDMEMASKVKPEENEPLTT
ncbi:solute carrier family 22 member 6-like isoform X2 [Macrobrachium rosenbergii]|uniref:solute carrier family 22 member 6-like isoform X2 n=1 Tax=Macrobrachium rosenbergii TaxID=79674 RepID=UPI0034D591AF